MKKNVLPSLPNKVECVQTLLLSGHIKKYILLILQQRCGVKRFSVLSVCLSLDPLHMSKKSSFSTFFCPH